MDKILLPLAFPIHTRRVVRQVAFLARHFRSEIILLHVLTPLSYPAGIWGLGHVLTEHDLHANTVRRAQRDLDQAMQAELGGITVRRSLLKGDPAHEIAQTARDERVSLIAMSTHGYTAIYRLLLGSTTAKVLHDSEFPVWTDTNLDEAPAQEFTVRRVLCAVDLSPHCRHTVSRAAQLAAEFDAHLTLVHITSSVDTFGPGGTHVVPEWKEAAVRFASTEIAKLQQDVGTSAEVIIDSGNVHKLLNIAAERTRSDLLVIGRRPSGGHLGDNGTGYAIIRESHIPVLSV
jgi:nucleotide-binding universal stress UspA family protein